MRALVADRVPTDDSVKGDLPWVSVPRVSREQCVALLPAFALEESPSGSGVSAEFRLPFVGAAVRRRAPSLRRP